MIKKPFYLSRKFSNYLLGEVNNIVPEKIDTIIRNEEFGATIFNKKNLKHIYVDFRGLYLFKLIDSQSNVHQLTERLFQTNRQPFFVLASAVLKYLKIFQNEGFISFDDAIKLNIKKEFFQHPLISAPNHISWLITNQCNLHCSHCGNTSRCQLKNELTTDEALKFVEDCAKYKVFVLNISGGEPFLRKGLFRILRRARGLGIEVAITTNGTLIDEGIVKKIKEITPFNIHISLDGVGNVHDDFRNQKGVFEKVLNTIKLFKRYEIPFGITTSISKRNFHDLDNIKNFIKDQKITSWEIYYAIPIGCLRKSQSLEPNELILFSKKIYDYKKELEGKVDIYIGDSLGYFGKYEIREGKWMGCLAGLNHCAIDPEGNMKGCPIQPPDFIEGNIRKEDFIKIWRDPDKFSYNRKGIKLEGFCQKCRYSEKCRGGCKTSNLAREGKLTVNHYCLYYLENKG